MKYVLMFVGTQEDQDRWDRHSKEERAAAMAAAGQWFGRYMGDGKVVGGEQLQGPHTVTTVRGPSGNRVVVDGLFIESKEIIGGFAIVEVKDRDEALGMAKAWPSGPVEVWPAAER